MKLNIDGAFYAEELQGVTGCCIRDDSGAFKFLLKQDGIPILQTLWLWKSWHAWTVCNLRSVGSIEMVEVESDSQSFVKLWTTRHGVRAETSPILADIQELSRMFNGFKLSFVCRNVNVVAHLCAKASVGR